MKKFSQVFSGLCLGLTLVVNLAVAADNTPKRTRRAQAPVAIKVVPWGPSQELVDAAKLRVERSKAVQSELGGTKYRLLEFSYLENESKSQTKQPPTRFRVVFYDYTNDRTIAAVGDFAGVEAITIHEEFYQPLPNDEEFAEAVRVLKQTEGFGSLLKNETLKTFQPMPPVTILDGTKERLVNVGLNTFGSAGKNEVVSVRMKDGKIIRYDKGAPETSLAAPTACGVPNAGQFTTSNGTAGQSQLTVVQDGSPLWEMLVIRPSASSGTRKSGIEVRDVKYRGKSVLKRGHVPVLNVEYSGDQCGPYRDWQYQEDMFQTAPGSNDIAPGIRILPPGQIAQTVLDNGTDVGDFRGVAIYTQNDETVLVTELQAGWYRYIMEWRFANDGTIRPRYGFGATNNSCVCTAHNHHAYWRFDFDIVNPTNKVFQVERGRKFLQPITTELTRLKNIQTNRSLLIQNSTGDEAYLLVPNLTDGVADNFGRSDFWVLQYKNVPGGTNLQNEIDDGYNLTGGNCTQNDGSCININKFINGESVVNRDVVVWYGAHFIHLDGENRISPDRSGEVLTGDHVVGPDIRPVRW
ncbi:MAG: hypothetical protein ACR2MG_02050 [Pyrinomonadaceae bacterium]